MTELNYNLNYIGYLEEKNEAHLPTASGIYNVYACTSYRLRSLLYIGEAENLRQRVLNHEKKSIWRQKLYRGEKLYFSYTLIRPNGARKRVEAALIYKHKPSCNTEYLYYFPFDTTYVTSKGKNAFIKNTFTVRRANNFSLGQPNFLSGGLFTK